MATQGRGDDEFVDAMDCLYALGKIELTTEGER